MASKLYGVDATVIVFVFVLFCSVLYKVRYYSGRILSIELDISCLQHNYVVSHSSPDLVRFFLLPLKQPVL